MLKKNKKNISEQNGDEEDGGDAGDDGECER